jgi:hypothetical protein
MDSFTPWSWETSSINMTGKVAGVVSFYRCMELYMYSRKIRSFKQTCMLTENENRPASASCSSTKRV